MMGREKKGKKSLVLILMLMLVFQSIGFAATSDSVYEVTGSRQGTGYISEGDVFIYKLTVKNLTMGVLNGVKASVSGDFALDASANATIGDIGVGDTEILTLPLKYNGSGNRLNILVVDATGKSIVDNVTIANVIESSTSSTDEPNKDQYYPDFDLLLDTKTPTFTAGVTKAFTFKLENKTTYTGKDVHVKFLNNDKDLPFDISINPVVSEKLNLSSKETKTFKMDVLPLGNVKSGYYTIPVKIEFKNVYGKPKTIEKNIKIEIINKKLPPEIVFSKVSIEDDILVPGKDQQVVFSLKNIGDLKARNIKVDLEGLALDKVMLNQDTKNKTLSSMDGDEIDFVVYNVSTSEALKDSKTMVELKITYQDDFGETYDRALQCYLNIAVPDASDLYDLKVDVTSQPKQIKPGDHFKVAFDVTNGTNIAWERLKLSLKTEGGFITKSQPVLKIDSIDPSKKASFVYELIAPDNMTTNNYPAYITLTDSKDNKSEHYLGLYVDGETQTSSKPKIIVDKYVYGGDHILAGETFDLTMTFFNTSSVMGIQNAKVSLASEGGAFTPVDASSSFFVPKIPAGGTVSHTITLKSKSDLNIKTYNVTASIEYEDSNGNSYDKKNVAYTAEENMGIPVMQELRLEVEELYVSPSGYVFQPMELSAEFFNMGKAPLSNMLISAEGDFDFQDSKLFVGNFNAGSNDYYSCMLVPLNVGENKGTVIFEFEDAVGEKHRVEKEFVVNAEEMNFGGDDMGGEFPEFPGDFDEPKEEDKKSKPWLKYGLIGGGILLVLIVLVVILKIRKNKKEMAFDD